LWRVKWIQQVAGVVEGEVDTAGGWCCGGRSGYSRWLVLWRVKWIQQVGGVVEGEVDTA